MLFNWLRNRQRRQSRSSIRRQHVGQASSLPLIRQAGSLPHKASPCTFYQPTLEALEDRITPSGLSFLDQSFGQLPLYFVQNQGQVSEAVDYYVQGSDAAVYFTSDGATFALTGTNSTQSSPGGEQAGGQRWAVQLDFLGANPNVKPIGDDRTDAVISYFRGTPDQWHTGLSTFGSVVYHDL